MNTWLYDLYQYEWLARDAQNKGQTNAAERFWQEVKRIRAKLKGYDENQIPNER